MRGSDVFFFNFCPSFLTKQHLGKIQGYYQLSEKVIKAASEFAVGRHVFSIGLPE